MSRVKILLISGHGAGDPGASAKINGVLYKEAEETIVMVQKIKEQLEPYDVEVDLYPVERNAYEDAKSGKFVCDIAQYDYVLEIHFNACVNDLNGNGKTTGTETFITKSDGTRTTEEKMLYALSLLGLKNRGVKSHNYTVIQKAKAKGADSCLLEVCFIDDADDMAIYLANKDKIAQSIAYGIVKGYSLSKIGFSKKTEETTVIAADAEEVVHAVVSKAKYYNNALVGTYIVNTKTDPLTMRVNAGTRYKQVVAIPKGAKVKCYGYYNKDEKDVMWLYVTYAGKSGYCHINYLKKQ